MRGRKKERESERERGIQPKRVHTLKVGRSDNVRTIDYVRHGSVNRQESWEMCSAFRIAHSVSQFKAQHIQLNLLYTPTKGLLKLINHPKWLL